MKDALAVVHREVFGRYQRFAIAYLNDVCSGSKNGAQWDDNPRLATRAECAVWVTAAIRSHGISLGDDTPNFDEATGKRLRDHRFEDDVA